MMLWDTAQGQDAQDVTPVCASPADLSPGRPLLRRGWISSWRDWCKRWWFWRKASDQRLHSLSTSSDRHYKHFTRIKQPLFLFIYFVLRSPIYLIRDTFIIHILQLASPRPMLVSWLAQNVTAREQRGGACRHGSAHTPAMLIGLGQNVGGRSLPPFNYWKPTFQEKRFSMKLNYYFLEPRCGLENVH